MLRKLGIFASVLLLAFVAFTGWSYYYYIARPLDEFDATLAAADKGDVTAQLAAGYSFLRFVKSETHSNPPRDAMAWFYRAYENGSAEGAFGLAQALSAESIDATFKSQDQVAWLTKAANLGHTKAMRELGSLLIKSGLDAEGIGWLRNAEAQGDIVAGNQVQSREAAVRSQNFANRASALEQLTDQELNKLIAAADPVAAFVKYQRMQKLESSLPNSQQETISLLTIAAEGGYLNAQAKLALAYHGGKLDSFDIKQNPDLALKWGTKAGLAGDLKAQMLVANIFLFGFKEIEQDPTKAFEWFSLASAQGDALAKYAIANGYEHGVGVKADKRLALKYYIDAASLGDRDAIKRLAETYTSGSLGTPVSDQEARTWREKL
jgi:uncharacterized protein